MKNKEDIRYLNIDAIERVDRVNKLIGNNNKCYLNNYKLIKLSHFDILQHYLLFSENGKYQIEFIYNKVEKYIPTIFINNQIHVDIIETDKIGFFLEIEYLVLNYIESSDKYKRFKPRFILNVYVSLSSKFVNRYYEHLMIGENLIKKLSR